MQDVGYVVQGRAVVRARRVDGNQREVVRAFEAAGGRWLDLSAVGNGCPDGLLCVLRTLYLVEIKNAKGRATSKGKIYTPAQEKFHASWPGRIHTVWGVNDALALVEAIRAVRNG